MRLRVGVGSAQNYEGTVQMFVLTHQISVLRFEMSFLL